MANEVDRVLFPGILKDTFEISLGAGFKCVEMIKSPQQAAEKMMTEAKTLITIPDDAGEGIKAKAEAIAAVWVEKSAALVNECKTAGQKFTEGT